MPRQRHRIAGIPFDFLPPGLVVEAIVRQPASRPLAVCMVNPHTVMSCHRRADVRNAVLAADLILPDGVGISLASRILGLSRCTRVPGPSLVLYLCDAGRSAGLKHFFYGGAPGVARRMAGRLAARYPGLQVAGCHSPDFVPDARDIPEPDRALINRSEPDIVWVGLGSPKQEMWVARNASKLRARAVIAVGAAFDFHSGNVPWAPEWARDIGIEWLYRLTKEPARLWRRNLDSPLFLGAVLRDLFQRRRLDTSTQT